MSHILTFLAGMASTFVIGRGKRTVSGRALAVNLGEEMSALGIDTAQGTVAAAQTTVFENQRALIVEALPKTLYSDVIRYYQTLIHLRDDLGQSRNLAQDLSRRKAGILPRVKKQAERSLFDLFLFGGREGK